jgi:starch synthase
MIKLAFVASEVAPFAKTGGLADVAGSLPKALKSKKMDVDVYMPLHGKISNQYREDMTFIGSTSIHMGWRTQYVGILHLEYGGVNHYFIDNEFYFGRND